MRSIPHNCQVDFSLPDYPAENPYFAVTTYTRQDDSVPVTTYHQLPDDVESPMDWLVGLSKDYDEFNANLRNHRRASRRAMWARNDGKVKWCTAGAVVSTAVSALLLTGVIPGFSVTTNGMMMLVISLMFFAVMCGYQVCMLVTNASKFDSREYPLAIVPREAGIRVYDSPLVPRHNKQQYPEFVIPGEDITKKVLSTEMARSS